MEDGNENFNTPEQIKKRIARMINWGGVRGSEKVGELASEVLPPDMNAFEMLLIAQRNEIATAMGIEPEQVSLVGIKVMFQIGDMTYVDEMKDGRMVKAEYGSAATRTFSRPGHERNVLNNL